MAKFLNSRPPYSNKSVFSPERIRKLIDTDEGFINIRRYGFSLQKTLDRFPDGAPDRVIANGLMITVEELQRVYEDLIARLRISVGDQSDKSDPQL